MDTRQKSARTAGLLYLLLAFIGPFNTMYIPSRFIVRGDPAATAERILSSELLYRAGIVADLASLVIFVLVVLALYRLLRDVDVQLARVMVALVVVSVGLSFTALLLQAAPLVVLREADWLSVFDGAEREALAMVFLRLRGQAITLAMAFWGLWLLPFGALVFRSGFIPRVLGVLLVIAGVSYLVSSVTSLLVPDYGRVVSRWLLAPAAIGELAIILWLAIRGVRPGPGPAERTTAAWR
ncbi:MAG: DUF4386 domain-containing protein [Steroidobacteraceae bacterium]|nr:DUF4386 domain-containing protein [Steroidobacteraceae bacterium]